MNHLQLRQRPLVRLQQLQPEHLQPLFRVFPFLLMQQPHQLISQPQLPKLILWPQLLELILWLQLHQPISWPQPRQPPIKVLILKPRLRLLLVVDVTFLLLRQLHLLVSFVQQQHFRLLLSLFLPPQPQLLLTLFSIQLLLLLLLQLLQLIFLLTLLFQKLQHFKVQLLQVLFMLQFFLILPSKLIILQHLPHLFLFMPMPMLQPFLVLIVFSRLLLLIIIFLTLIIISLIHFVIFQLLYLPIQHFLQQLQHSKLYFFHLPTFSYLLQFVVLQFTLVLDRLAGLQKMILRHFLIQQTSFYHLVIWFPPFVFYDHFIYFF